MPAKGSLKGRLLVSSPALRDPNFDHTVVLVLEHVASEGALGVVLNRPTDREVHEVLPGWGSLADEPGVLFTGGPVAPEAAICLARLEGEASPDVWKPVDGPLGTLDLSRDPIDVMARVANMRVFVGYSGWDAGQLEDEIAVGGWFVVEALPGDAFAPAPEWLWRAVLRRQPDELALVASYPVNPALN